MYGYTISTNSNTQAQETDICYKNIVCSNHMIDKFQQDKIFTETDDFIILLDGVILNRDELWKTKTKGDFDLPWSEVVINLYKSEGECFFSLFRGSFSGAIFDKKADKWIVFGDQIGSKFTFWAKVGDFFCVAEEMGQVYKMMSANDINYSLSIDSAYLLLTFGFMVDDKTLCEQVKKIKPGYYIVYEDGVVTEKKYYLLNNDFDFSIIEKDAIEIVDEYFRKAVILAFNKDCEYNYNHLVALSGGLDSRMTSFVAHECGYTSQLNYTFSQSDYYDETIPKQIANDLKHDWIFKFLNNGLWLYDVDEVTDHTGGNVLYYGTAHGNSLYKYLNFERLGIVHTGQISGGLNGSHVSNYDDKYDCFDYREAMYSTKYYERIRHLLSCKVNQELGWYYYRCLNGTCYGTQMVYNYSESYSPFLDIDFLEHMLRIPIEYRIGHNLYKKWILLKYPKAAQYIWENTGRTINTPMLHIGDRHIPLANIPSSITSHLKILFGINNNNGLKKMNPIAYYISHNKELQDFLTSYFEYTDAIKDSGLRKDILNIKTSGSAMEKIQAISLLSAIKLFY